MQLTKNLMLLAGLAAYAVAQDDSVCDPDNDDNNDQTCTSSAVATDTAIQVSSPVNTVYTTTDANSRISLITSVDTGLVVSTTYDTNVMTTSLPHSLDTVTTGIPQVVTYTSQSVYTTNTLTTTGDVTIITTSTGALTSGAFTSTSSGDSDSDSTDTAAAAMSTSSDSGAYPSAFPKFALGGVAAGVFGLAVAL